MFLKRLLLQLCMMNGTTVEKYLNPLQKIDPMIRPKELLSYLHTKQGINEFILTFNLPQSQAGTILHKLIVTHLCLIHDYSLCGPFQELSFESPSLDQWLNEKLFKPYNNFLQSICYSREMYKDLRLDKVIIIDFDHLFASRNLLVKLLHIVRKIDKLEVYYTSKERKDSKIRINKKHINQLVCILSYHAQQLYAVFKAILGEMLQFPDLYLPTASQIQMIKFIIPQDLQQINDQLKYFFLSKRLKPIGKGYGIKLLRIEQLSEERQMFIHTITSPMKKMKKKSLDSYIFGRDGKMNEGVFQSLKIIRRNSTERSLKTFRSNFILRTNTREEIIQL